MAGLILGLRPANERCRYKLAPSLIGWSQTQIQPCYGEVLEHSVAPFDRYIKLNWPKDRPFRDVLLAILIYVTWSAKTIESQRYLGKFEKPILI